MPPARPRIPTVQRQSQSGSPSPGIVATLFRYFLIYCAFSITILSHCVTFFKYCINHSGFITRPIGYCINLLQQWWLTIIVGWTITWLLSIPFFVLFLGCDPRYFISLAPELYPYPGTQPTVLEVIKQQWALFLTTITFSGTPIPTPIPTPPPTHIPIHPIGHCVLGLWFIVLPHLGLAFATNVDMNFEKWSTDLPPQLSQNLTRMIKFTLEMVIRSFITAFFHGEGPGHSDHPDSVHVLLHGLSKVTNQFRRSLINYNVSAAGYTISIGILVTMSNLPLIGPVIKAIVANDHYFPFILLMWLQYSGSAIILNGCVSLLGYFNRIPICESQMILSKSADCPINVAKKGKRGNKNQQDVEELRGALASILPKHQLKATALVTFVKHHYWQFLFALGMIWFDDSWEARWVTAITVLTGCAVLLLMELTARLVVALRDLDEWIIANQNNISQLNPITVSAAGYLTPPSTGPHVLNPTIFQCQIAYFNKGTSTAKFLPWFGSLGLLAFPQQILGEMRYLSPSWAEGMGRLNLFFLTIILWLIVHFCLSTKIAEQSQLLFRQCYINDYRNVGPGTFDQVFAREIECDPRSRHDDDDDDPDDYLSAPLMMAQFSRLFLVKDTIQPTDRAPNTFQALLMSSSMGQGVNSSLWPPEPHDDAKDGLNLRYFRHCQFIPARVLIWGLLSGPIKSQIKKTSVGKAVMERFGLVSSPKQELKPQEQPQPEAQQQQEPRQQQQSSSPTPSQLPPSLPPSSSSPVPSPQPVSLAQPTTNAIMDSTTTNTTGTTQPLPVKSLPIPTPQPTSTTTAAPATHKTVNVTATTPQTTTTTAPTLTTPHPTTATSPKTATSTTLPPTVKAVKANSTPPPQTIKVAATPPQTTTTSGPTSAAPAAAETTKATTSGPTQPTTPIHPQTSSPPAAPTIPVSPPLPPTTTPLVKKPEPSITMDPPSQRTVEKNNATVNNTVNTPTPPPANSTTSDKKIPTEPDAIEEVIGEEAVEEVLEEIIEEDDDIPLNLMARTTTSPPSTTNTRSPPPPRPAPTIIGNYALPPTVLPSRHNDDNQPGLDQSGLRRRRKRLPKLQTPLNKTGPNELD